MPKINAIDFDGATFNVDGFMSALRNAVESGKRVEIVGTPRIGTRNPAMGEIRAMARRTGAVIVWA